MSDKIEHKFGDKYFVKFGDVVARDKDILLIGKQGYPGNPMTVDHLIYCIAEGEDENHVTTLTRERDEYKLALELACNAVDQCPRCECAEDCPHYPPPNCERHFVDDYLTQATNQLKERDDLSET